MSEMRHTTAVFEDGVDGRDKYLVTVIESRDGESPLIMLAHKGLGDRTWSPSMELVRTEVSEILDQEETVDLRPGVVPE